MQVESLPLRKTVLPESYLSEPDTRCHVRVITTNAEFDALETEWNRVLDHAGATVFQTYEWQRTWWKYFATSRDGLNILLFQYENTIVGIAPLYKRHMSFFGLLGTVHVQCIGHGLSDYLDFIIQPGHEQMVYSALALHLRASAHDWDVLDIEDVNEKSTLIKFLPGVLENHGIHYYQYQGNVCPAITLPVSEELLMEGLGSSANYNFKRKSKRLHQNFKAEVHAIQHETDDIKNSIETFAKIHGERWTSLGYPSAFDNESHRAFHVEFSKKFARRGWLRMFFLYVNGKPTAVNYSFNYNKRIYMYHSNAYGPEGVMKCSPGLIIRNIAMVEGIREGMRTFDFLRGDESYKYTEWKAVDSKNFLLRLSSPSGKARPRFVAFLVLELLRKAITRLQRETYEYRRFMITKPRTVFEKINYAGVKGTNLLILAYNFILRHAPVRALRKFQITQRSAHEQVK